MKYVFTLMAVLGLSYKCAATGSLVLNSSQSGVVTFVATNSVVTTFSPAFTAPPVMSLFGSVTNLIPLTNTVTSSNFTLVIAATNASAGGGWGSVAWTAQQGATLIQYGTVTNAAAATGVNVTFPTPFAYPPLVYMTGGLTNVTAVPGVQSVTYTNFTYGENIATTNSWMAIGTAAAPGATTVTH